jgi:hypothetical protein
MPEHSLRSVEQFYAEFAEDHQLKSGRGQLEFERTKEIVQRFLPAPPAVVADVGGGTGPYSFWLAALAYEFHLIKPSVRQCLGKRGIPTVTCDGNPALGTAR